MAVLLLDEVTELRELVQEGGHDVAVPAPVLGELRDGDGKCTRAVFGRVRFLNRLPLHQVAESLELRVLLFPPGMKIICQMLWQDVGIVRALVALLLCIGRVHSDCLFLVDDVPDILRHPWASECRTTLARGMVK